MNSNLPSNIDMQTGVGSQLGGQNPNGMLWYMPKAHLGMEASFIMKNKLTYGLLVFESNFKCII